MAINSIETVAPAKINLFLEVLGKRADGFHELETVMSTVSLFDRLSFSARQDEHIRLEIVQRSGQTLGEIPTDETNLICRALQLLKDRAAGDAGLDSTGGRGERSGLTRPLGCDVRLQKNIPSAAGLGGASSDAACALLTGCQLWGLKFKPEQLHEMATELGSDVPFFLYGGAAVCRGRGEIISPLNPFGGVPIVIAKPPVACPTGAIFGQFRESSESRSATDTIESLTQQDLHGMAGSLFNRLQPVVSQLTDQVSRLAEAFSQTPCLGHQMSGSGSSYFGVFPTQRVARQAAGDLSNRLSDTRIVNVHTLGPTLSTVA